MTAILIMPCRNSAKWLKTTFSFMYKLKPQPELVLFREDGSVDDTRRMVDGYRKPHVTCNCKIDFEDGPYGRIGPIRQHLLEHVRQLNVDSVLWIDSDVTLRTPDIIDVLGGDPADVVGGAYPILWDGKVYTSGVWAEGAAKFLYRDMALERFDTSVVGVGSGCMFLNHDVLYDDRVRFWPLINGNIGEDINFCLMAKINGYSVGLDSTVKVGHLIDRHAKKPWRMENNMFK